LLDWCTAACCLHWAASGLHPGCLQHLGAAVAGRRWAVGGGRISKGPRPWHLLGGSTLVCIYPPHDRGLLLCWLLTCVWKAERFPAGPARRLLLLGSWGAGQGRAQDTRSACTATATMRQSIIAQGCRACIPAAGAFGSCTAHWPGAPHAGAGRGSRTLQKLLHCAAHGLPRAPVEPAVLATQFCIICRLPHDVDSLTSASTPPPSHRPCPAARQGGAPQLDRSTTAHNASCFIFGAVGKPAGAVRKPPPAGGIYQSTRSPRPRFWACVAMVLLLAKQQVQEYLPRAFRAGSVNDK
jgi:hypothetical protein